MMIEEFLANLKEFGERDNEMKIVKLKKVKQESRTMEKFIQEFRRAVRGSGYEGRLFVKKFK